MPHPSVMVKMLSKQNTVIITRSYTNHAAASSEAVNLMKITESGLAVATPSVPHLM